MSIYNCDRAGNQSITELVVFALRLLAKPSSCVQWYSEARLTETSEFGAEKGLLQGHARRRGISCPEKSQLAQGFDKALLKAR